MRGEKDRCTERWEDAGRSGEIWGDLGRCGEMTHRCMSFSGRMNSIRPRMAVRSPMTALIIVRAPVVYLPRVTKGKCVRGGHATCHH